MKKTKGLVSFAETILGADLWDAQRAMLDAIEQNRQVAVAACHASGKSYAAACAAIGFAALHADSRVLTIAPGWLMTRTVLWSEIHALIERAKYKLPVVSSTQTEIRLGTRNMILGLSAADAGRLQGHHAEHILIIADEAAALDDSFWPAIHGVLASGNSRLLLLGNPTTTTGYFRDCFGSNRTAWTTISIGAFDCPNLAGLTLEQLLRLPDAELDVNERPYLVTRRWVRERFPEWYNGSPENSPLWQSRVLGTFPSESTNSLFPLSWLEAARRPAVDTHGDILIGVDVAGPGRDRTICVAVCNGAILETQIITAPDATGPISAFLKRWRERLRIARIDSSGLGWYCLQTLQKEGWRIEGINVGSAAKDKERFTNLKAERYWDLREAFQKGHVSGLSDDMLAELAAINYMIASNGKTQIEDKSSVKSALGKSPDLAEALMLALGEPAYEPFRFIRVLPASSNYEYSTGYARRLSQWELDKQDDAREAANRRSSFFGGGFRRIRKSRRWDGGTW